MREQIAKVLSTAGPERHYEIKLLHLMIISAEYPDDSKIVRLK